MSVLKIVAALLVIAGGALVGAAVGGAFDSTEVTDKAEPIKVVRREPTVFSFLAEEITTANTSSYGTDKVGGKYKNYLVGVYGTNDSNKKWWEESYERYRKLTSWDDLSDEFAKDKIDKAYAAKSNNTDTKSLNNVCDSIYKKQLTATVAKTDAGNGTKYKKALWTYCSDLKGVPLNIEESENSKVDTIYPQVGETSSKTDSIGKTKKKDLLSTLAAINEKLWRWKQEEFFSKNDVTEKHFKDLKDNTSKKSNKLSLKEACESAYKKKPESEDKDDKVKPETVIKYCSLNGAAA